MWNVTIHIIQIVQVVVKYTSEFCHLCSSILPTFAKMSETFQSHLYVVADADACREMSAGMRYTPTFAFYNKGRKVDELVGINQQHLRDRLWLHQPDDPYLP